MRLVGLKESEGENLRELTCQLIGDVLGVKLAVNELQRVYRPGPTSREKNSPPRSVIIVVYGDTRKNSLLFYLVLMCFTMTSDLSV